MPIHGVICELERESIGRNAFAVAIREMLGVESGTPEAKILNERVRYFLVDHDRRKRIVVGIGSEYFAQNIRFQTLQRELAGVPLVLFDGRDQIRPAIDEILH